METTATTLMIVFAGTTAFFAVALRTVYRVLHEDMVSQKENAVGAASPTRRFVSPEKLLNLRFCTCLALAMAGILLLVWNGVALPIVFLPVGVALGVIGWQVPKVWLSIKARKRKMLFDAQILNLTMTLANGLRSGQALPQALDAAARRIDAPMKEELAVVLQECRLGLDMPDALERLYKRMPGEDLQLLLTSIRLTLQSGGSLADVLERMVEMIRSRTEFLEKVKTMTAQGRFEAMAMSLAPVFVYILLRLIDPELMRPLTTTPVGWCTIVAVAITLGIGFFVINKIVTIEV